MSADRCIGISNTLGMFFRTLRCTASLWVDEMGHDEVAKGVETREEVVVRLGFMESDGPI